MTCLHNLLLTTSLHAIGVVDVSSILANTILAQTLQMRYVSTYDLPHDMLCMLLSLGQACQTLLGNTESIYACML